MGNQTTNSGQQEHAALLYGMQRTGSNYTEQVLLKNFHNIHFYNNDFARCLPVHKHFRLYDEKAVIPDVRYYNNFIYKDFKEFKEHVELILGRSVKLFIVTMKDPYSWYISYKKHAKKNEYTYIKNSLNSHYIIDYNLFYKKWLDFSVEAPGEVLMVKYEELIGDLNASLQRMGQKLKLDRSSEQSVNPSKVFMNKRFTSSKANYYKDKLYLDLISDRELSVIQHLLDPELISSMKYQIIS